MYQVKAAIIAAREDIVRHTKIGSRHIRPNRVVVHRCSAIVNKCRDHREEYHGARGSSNGQSPPGVTGSTLSFRSRETTRELVSADGASAMARQYLSIELAMSSDVGDRCAERSLTHRRGSLFFARTVDWNKWPAQSHRLAGNVVHAKPAVRMAVDSATTPLADAQFRDRNNRQIAPDRGRRDHDWYECAHRRDGAHAAAPGDGGTTRSDRR